jgi:hypothetical protein
MLLSPADFGPLGLGRILSDRIGSKSTHIASVNQNLKGRLIGGLFVYLNSSFLLSPSDHAALALRFFRLTVEPGKLRIVKS